MKLSFYYHIPITQKDESLFIQGFLGVFLDSLASEVEHLFLVMHKSNEEESKTDDYKLKSKNISFISLGLKTPAWHRAIFHNKILKTALNKINDCDKFIVRSPSPLAPYFAKYIDNNKLIYMIVGDYMEAVKQTKAKGFRNKMINVFLSYNNKMFEKIIKKSNILVNSPTLQKKYKDKVKSIHLIKTTTLSIDDFYFREDTCQNQTIQLLYTGRFDLQKGLLEFVEATSILLKNNINVQLNFVGWENDRDKPIEKLLLKKAKDLKIDSKVVFHGKKTIGAELNAMYKMADIYVLPSYHEGFPRTIWEAMANSLPVIATKVGGIPDYLTNKKNAILINPKNSEEIADSINNLIEKNDLRKKIIKNGLEIAKNVILEVQSKKIINIIKNV